MSIKPFIALSLPFVFILSACQTTTPPTLAPQPVHTANPMPAPVLGKHHSDDLPQSLFDGTWQLRGIKNAENDILFNRLTTKTTLKFFGKDNETKINVSATIGCNGIWLHRDLASDGTITKSETLHTIKQMASCGVSSDSTERRFTEFLSDSQKLALKNGVLFIYDDKGNVLSFIKRPEAKDTRPIPEQLSESLWVLSDKSLTNPSSLNDLDANAKVSFSEYNDNNLIGIRATIGCNNKDLTIKMDNDGNISRHKGIVISTLIGCGDKINQMEDDFVYFVANAKTMSLNNGRLIIVNDKGDTLTFVRQN